MKKIGFMGEEPENNSEQIPDTYIRDIDLARELAERENVAIENSAAKHKKYVRKLQKLATKSLMTNKLDDAYFYGKLAERGADLVRNYMEDAQGIYERANDKKL